MCGCRAVEDLPIYGSLQGSCNLCELTKESRLFRSMCRHGHCTSPLTKWNLSRAFEQWGRVASSTKHYKGSHPDPASTAKDWCPIGPEPSPLEPLGPPPRSDQRICWSERGGEPVPHSGWIRFHRRPILCSRGQVLCKLASSILVPPARWLLDCIGAARCRH